MATLYRRGKYWWIGININGKQHLRSLRPLCIDSEEDTRKANKIKKQIEAEQELNLLRVKKYDNNNSNLKLTNAFEKFLFAKSSSRKKTTALYKNAYNMFLNSIGNKPVDQIDLDDVYEYLNYLKRYTYSKSNNGAIKKLSINTIEIYLRQIRIFFNYLVDIEALKKNPIPSNKKLGIKTKFDYAEDIPENDLNKILNYLKTKNIIHYRFIMYLRLTAVHPIEAIKARWENINWSDGYIKFTWIKKDKPHIFPLYDQLKEFLLEFKQPHGELFPSLNSTDSLRFWKKAIKHLKLPNYKLTQIRKTTITDIILSNATFDTVHAFSGHSNPNTTYKHYRAIRIRKLTDEINKKIKF